MTPKPRQKNTNWPKYVTAANGRVVYRPRIAPTDRQYIDTDKNGFLKPPIRLGAPTDSDDQIINAYLSAKNNLKTRCGSEKHSLRWVLQQYLQSAKFKSLAPGSQQRSAAFVGVIDHAITADGKAQTFGDLPIRHISKPMVRRLAEKRLADYQARGRKGTAQVNREITLLSTATQWASEYIDDLQISDNPFRIGKFTEQKNTRYVTDEEFRIQSETAGEVAPYLPIVFEITYLIAARGVETLDITLADIDPDRTTGGIYIHRRKGSKDNIIEWSDRLYAAYLAARAQHAKFKISSIDAPLILSTKGAPLRKSSLDTAMQRLKDLMSARGLSHIYWSLHKIKAKGISDAENNRIAGHQTEAMREQYSVKTERHKPAR